MGLQAAIDDVQNTVAGLTGIRAAPHEPPESLNVYPFCVAYAGSGSWEYGPMGDKKGIQNIVLELHVARKDLARDIAAAMAYCESIPNAIMADPTLGGTVNTISGPIVYTFGALSWAGTDTLGFRWTIPVKLQSAIT